MTTYLLIPHGTALLVEPKRSSEQWVAKRNFIAEVWREVAHSYQWIKLHRQGIVGGWNVFDHVGGPTQLCYVQGTFPDRFFTRCVAQSPDDAASVFDRLVNPGLTLGGRGISLDEEIALCVVVAVEKGKEEK